MTIAIAYVLVLMVVALVLFALDVLRVDIVALILLLLLTVPARWIPGLLTPEQALAGFGSETIMVLIALFMLTAGVVKTGVVERIGLRLAALGGTRPVVFSRFIVLSAGAISAFVSNTLTTAVFVPVVIGASRRAHMPASKLLMPLAFASILTGSITVIGTSTNLVVSGMLPSYGQPRIGFFELAPVGVVIAVIGLAYLLFLAPRLIPDRGEADAEASKDARQFRTELVVTEKSPLAGKTLAQLRLGDILSVFVVNVRSRSRRKPRVHDKLKEGDELVIEGTSQDILSVKDLTGMEIKPDVELAEPGVDLEGTRIVEAMVLPRSPLVGRTLAGARFHERTGLTVLGLNSAHKHRKIENLSSWPLRPSDVLLLQGKTDDIESLPSESLLLLEDVSGHHPRSAKGPLAAAIFITAIVLGATNMLALPVAFLLGVLCLVLTNCLTADEAYSAVDWRLLVMIGAMMAFGKAMETSGASTWIAGLVVEHVSPLGATAVMAAFFLLTMGLSQPMSNQAAVLIVLPVAIATAQGMGLDPRSIVITVMLAASCSFLTPLEPSCLLVYGPGRYRFFDFMRAGLPLTAIAFVITMLLVPVFWPMTQS